MNRCGHRLDQDRQFIRKIGGKINESIGGEGERIGQCSRRQATEDIKGVTDVGSTRPALFTLPAVTTRIEKDP